MSRTTDIQQGAWATENSSIFESYVLESSFVPDVVFIAKPLLEQKLDGGGGGSNDYPPPRVNLLR